MVVFTFVSESSHAGHIELVPEDSRYSTYAMDRRTGWTHERDDISISKIVDGTSRPLGIASVKSRTVTCNEHTIVMRRSHAWSLSDVFMASNGLQLKWKVRYTLGAELRVVNDDAHSDPSRTVAVYKSQLVWRPKAPPTLVVHEEGLPVLDEVIATAVYIARRLVMLNEGNEEY
ncbi:hypothetical protein GLOTRDRAFT_112272 [Gloeophyllum trabeum ATCC 11539]|uniref:DUF6593 domain-containing protein n=1 Tax=Gloeophyllum trabeum (strain ATCC 11539 / FP-39264 / Madison 617) TaxID=670483 RepID=S7PYD3_GLOTA|nr:uncharacterized protein GLOTRDRAFT_112272 [Gloeophyllum trabeum ATCC 11539]EPQ52362.1 hypothetical protein GLOTRDRAFT_112272 [Gloeophyllum trabeum ATCC 11539]